MIRRLAGFYRVHGAGADPVECVLRGRLKLVAGPVLVGDRVLYATLEPGKGVIEEVLPRSTQLERPPVANVDTLVAVVALCSPTPNRYLLDRQLVMAHFYGISPVICISKADLAAEASGEKGAAGGPTRSLTGDDRPDTASFAAIEALARPYRTAGYPVVATSAVTGLGIAELRQLLRGRVATLAGQSGVGKSALLNALCGQERSRTGEISRRLGRGRHTTRTVELIPLEGGGLVADTPGFSRLNLGEIPVEELAGCFPEFGGYSAACRFEGCLHRAEPDCAVRRAVEQGQIDPERHDHYLQFLGELEGLEAQRLK